MADFQNQKERIKAFIKAINLTNSAFEKSLDLSNGYINSMRKGLGYDKLEQLSNTYPILNIGWLLTGEGSMYKSEAQPSTIGNGNIAGNIANNSNIISTNANGNFNNVQTSIGGDSKKVEKETNKLKLEISKLKAEIERLNEKNSHLMENMQVKDDLIASLKAMIEVLQGK